MPAQVIRYMLILFSIGLAAVGQIILKIGMDKLGQIGFSLEQLISTFTNPIVLGGLFFYGVSLILWLIVLSREQLSFVYPMVALSYVVTTVLARLILKEDVPALRWFGLLVIMAGIVMVARS